MADNILATAAIAIDNTDLDKLSKQLDDIDRKLKRGEAAFEDIGEEAEKSAKQASDSWAKFGSNIGKWIGTAVGATAVAGFALIVKNTIDAQNEFAALESVVRSTGQAAGYSAQELSKMIDQMARVTGQSGGDINAAAVRLLTYTDIVGNQFPRALQAAIDWQARYGGSFEAAAELIGKALQEPSRAAAALSKQGFTFTEEQKKMLKALEDTGQLAEAQAYILDTLNESIRGAAEAARNTLGGALKALWNAFNDTLEVTEESTSNMDDFTKSVNRLTNLLQDPAVKQSMQDFIGWFADLGVQIAEGAVLLVDYGNKLKNIFSLRTKEAVQSSESLVALTQRQAAVFKTLENITNGGLGARLVEMYRPETVLTYNRSLMSQEELIADLKREYLDIDKRIWTLGESTKATTEAQREQTRVGHGVSSAIQEEVDKLKRQTEVMGKSKTQIAELARQRLLATAKTEDEKNAINEAYNAHIRAIQATEASTKSTKARQKAVEDAAKAQQKYNESLDATLAKMEMAGKNLSYDANNEAIITGLRSQAQRSIIAGETISGGRDEMKNLWIVDQLESGIKYAEQLGAKVQLLRDKNTGAVVTNIDVSGILSGIDGFENQPLEEQERIRTAITNMIEKQAFGEESIGKAIAHNTVELKKYAAETALIEQYAVNTRVNESTITGIREGQLRTTEQVTRFMQQQEFIERLRVQAAKEGYQIDEARAKKQFEAYQDSNRRLAEEQKRIAESQQMVTDIGNMLANSITDALNTGRFEFKQFLYDLGTYLLSSSIKKIFATLFDLNNTGSGGGGWIGTVAGIIGSFFTRGASVGPTTTGTINSGSSYANYAYKGAIGQNGNYQFFANGGVLNRRTSFPMANGRTGVAGEAGPEGVLPLTRTSTGKLGVHAVGAMGQAQNTGGIVQNNQFTIIAQNTENASRDDAKFAKDLTDTIRHITRQEMAEQQRVGGMLNPNARGYSY